MGDLYFPSAPRAARGASDRFSVALSRLVIASPSVLHSEQLLGGGGGKKVVPTTRAAP